MSFLVKYGRYSVASFFNTSEARRAIFNVIGDTGGGTGTVMSVKANTPLYMTGSSNQPVININPAFLLTTSSQNISGVKNFISTPTTSTPAGGFQDPNQIVNKNYIDTVAAGLKVVASVVAATLPEFGSGLGLYAGDDMDDVTLADQDRVLLKDEPNAEDNGIYVIHASPTAPTRAADYDSDIEVKGGTFTTVLGGTINANTQWAQTTEYPTLGTDPLRFSKLGIASSVISVNSQTGAVNLTASDIGLDQVDNTADLYKPVSFDTQAGLDSKVNLINLSKDGVGVLSDIVDNPAADFTQSVVLVTDHHGKMVTSITKSEELDQLQGISLVSTIQAQLTSKAPKLGAELTNATANVTPSLGDNSTKLATTAYVDRVAIVPQVRQLIADTANYTLATYSTVTELGQFTLQANSTYYFKFKCLTNTNAGTGTGMLAIGFTSGSANSINYIKQYPNTSTTIKYSTVTAVDSAPIPTSGVGATLLEDLMEGQIKTGPSPLALVLRVKLKTAGAGLFVKVMAGSFGFVQKIV